jgi:hypothetical protein
MERSLQSNTVGAALPRLPGSAAPPSRRTTPVGIGAYEQTRWNPGTAHDGAAARDVDTVPSFAEADATRQKETDEIP